MQPVPGTVSPEGRFEGVCFYRTGHGILCKAWKNPFGLTDRLEWGFDEKGEEAGKETDGSGDDRRTVDPE